MQPNPSPTPTHPSQEAEDRFRSALLSYLILSGLSEEEAQRAGELVAGVAWLLGAGHTLREGGAR